MQTPAAGPRAKLSRIPACAGQDAMPAALALGARRGEEQFGFLPVQGPKVIGDREWSPYRAGERGGEPLSDAASHPDRIARGAWLVEHLASDGPFGVIAVVGA